MDSNNLMFNDLPESVKKLTKDIGILESDIVKISHNSDAGAWFVYTLNVYLVFSRLKKLIESPAFEGTIFAVDNKLVIGFYPEDEESDADDKFIRLATKHGAKFYRRDTLEWIVLDQKDNAMWNEVYASKKDAAKRYCEVHKLI